MEQYREMIMKKILQCVAGVVICILVVVISHFH